MPKRSQLGCVFALVLVTLLAGCHKKVKSTPPPPPPPAPEVQPASQPEATTPTPESIPPTPAPETPKVADVTPPAPPPAKKPVVRKPPPTAKPAPAPKANPPETASLGELSAGNSPDNSKLRAQTTALIAGIEKRIKALPASTLKQQQYGLTKVQLFLKQAKDALNSGDPEGANNLATKSKLLLDDLLK